jgi:hypothetical protein
LLTAALAALLALLLAPPVLASHNLQAMLEDDQAIGTNPAGTFAMLRLLGVQRVRVPVRWSSVAPLPNSTRPPRRFNAADPASYPARSWASWDTIVRDAEQAGIGLDFDVTGGAPRWALGSGWPAGNTNPNWDPSPSLFGEFVRAVGVRYSGNYNPRRKRITPHDPSDLPRVSFWSIWNEPDYGPSLAPQGVPGNLRVENSPRMYRNLVDAAWSALRRTGHARDTFLFGELAPRGMNYWGVFSGMKPLVFLRALYCVDSSYRPLQGGAAVVRGCPSTPSGSRRFRSQNPALFDATGFSDHPYMRWYPPNDEVQPDSDYASLGEIGNLEHTLDRLQRVYASRKRFAIWNTEFGYITSPPKHDGQYERSVPHYQPWPSQTTAAYYLNWAEYISWRNPRIASFFQYELRDPLPSLKSDDWGGFASGLLNYNGSQKSTYAAWRLPLYMPATSARRGHKLEVWGCLRPAHFAILDTGLPQSVKIQLQPLPGTPFRTVGSVTLRNPNAGCYFDVRVRFPSGGAVRLSWDYPTFDPELGYLDPLRAHTAHSRSVGISVG